MSDVPILKGKDGFEMPILGFGTWMATSEEELEAALESALEAGYRHIDTAFAYMNERLIGNVLKRWMDDGRLTRQELFITTKLPIIGIRPEHVQKFLDLSLERLQLDYVDLYLIHVPFGLSYVDDDTLFPTKPDGSLNLDMNTDIVAVWKKMEEQVDAGKCKHAGVSNFSEEQVGRILAAARIAPVNNQIQLHAYLQQPKLVKYLQDNNIVVTSYSTLGAPGFCSSSGIQFPSLLTHETVKAVATEVDRTPAQVLLRHMIQKEIAVIPKSVTPTRIQQNFQALDFTLSDDQMKRLDELDNDINLVNFRSFAPGIEKHPEYQLVQ